MKKLVCALLCLAITLGTWTLCLAESEADAGEDGGWVLSAPFVARMAPQRSAVSETQTQDEAPEEAALELSGGGRDGEMAAGEEGLELTSEDSETGQDGRSEQARDPSRTEAQAKAPDSAQFADVASKRPELDEALVFWQDGAPKLQYNWDAHAGMWSADPMEPEVFPVYVTNHSNQAVGPFAVSAGVDSAVDDGGLFRLEARLFETARSLTLLPGESACVGEFVFSGEGGETGTACTNTLVIELCASYVD